MFRLNLSVSSELFCISLLLTLKSSAQAFEAIRQSRFRCPNRNIQHGRSLNQRQFVQVKQDHDCTTRRRQIPDELRQTLNQLTWKLALGIVCGQRGQRRFIADLVAPTPFTIQISKRLTRRDLIGPGTERLRLSQPAQFPVNANEDFLKDVFSLVLVSDEADDVAKQRFLNTLEELVQSLVAAGLCLQHPPAFPLRRLIGHALNRPTD